jgi:hypothetical protein
MGARRGEEELAYEYFHPVVSVMKGAYPSRGTAVPDAEAVHLITPARAASSTGDPCCLSCSTLLRPGWRTVAEDARRFDHSGRSRT